MRPLKVKYNCNDLDRISLILCVSTFGWLTVADEAFVRQVALRVRYLSCRFHAFAVLVFLRSRQNTVSENEHSGATAITNLF